MKKYRKIKALLLAGAMAVSLAACGNSGASGNPSNETRKVEEETTQNTEEQKDSSLADNQNQDTDLSGETQFPEDALVIAEQGVFSAGGTVLETEGTFDPVNGQYDPTGQTHHADHASVFYQIPAETNGHAMMFLHGYGQSRTGWMTTPDGREGWNDLFLKRGYSTYLVDQPRRGDAGQTSVAQEIPTVTQDQAWFTQFRLGRWPEFNEGTQFPTDEDSIDQFFRQMTPDTGAFDQTVIADALVEAFEKSGPGILVTHSQGGMPGWEIGAKSDNVEAVVAIEPGSVPFPASMSEDEIVYGYQVPDEEFAKLIEKPITIYMGDYIPAEGEASDLPAENFWAMVLAGCRQFAEVANGMGGDVTVVYLPDEGITGNSHFMFQELNNDVVADHLYAWLESKGLN